MSFLGSWGFGFQHQVEGNVQRKPKFPILEKEKRKIKLFFTFPYSHGRRSALSLFHHTPLNSHTHFASHFHSRIFHFPSLSFPFVFFFSSVLSKSVIFSLTHLGSAPITPFFLLFLHFLSPFNLPL